MDYREFWEAKNAHLNVIDIAIEIVDFGRDIDDLFIAESSERSFHDYEKVSTFFESLVVRLEFAVLKINGLSIETLEDARAALRRIDQMYSPVEWNGEIENHQFDLCDVVANQVIEFAVPIAHWYNGSGWDAVDTVERLDDKPGRTLHQTKEEDIEKIKMVFTNDLYSSLKRLLKAVEMEWGYVLDHAVVEKDGDVYSSENTQNKFPRKIDNKDFVVWLMENPPEHGKLKSACRDYAIKHFPDEDLKNKTEQLRAIANRYSSIWKPKDSELS